MILMMVTMIIMRMRMTFIMMMTKGGLTWPRGKGPQAASQPDTEVLTPCCTMHNAHSTQQSAQSKVHNAHFTPHIAHFIWHTLRCKMRTKMVLRV